ncbi:hypothetical protein KFE98_00290 [bacterium SCSIO 12741]|nr:hypothetical protein KFE98_00290 [bacterium SCSIO 12741]
MNYKKYDSREEQFARYDLEAPEVIFARYCRDLDPEKHVINTASQYRELVFGMNLHNLPSKYRKPLFQRYEGQTTQAYYKFLIHGLKFVHKLYFLGNQLVLLEVLCRETNRYVLEQLVESAHLNYKCDEGVTCFTPSYAFRLETKMGLRFLYFGNDRLSSQLIRDFHEETMNREVIREVVTSHLLKFQTIV